MTEGSHHVSFDSCFLTGFWDLAGNGQTNAHTDRQTDDMASSMLTFSKSLWLWKQKSLKQTFMDIINPGEVITKVESEAMASEMCLGLVQGI